ncbi:MAG: hypothetical protein GYA34_01395 [Chloroflexi bacterium]|nr:hypothetical protein [Chloroflexota bacterium]
MTPSITPGLRLRLLSRISLFTRAAREGTSASFYPVRVSVFARRLPVGVGRFLLSAWHTFLCHRFFLRVVALIIIKKALLSRARH